MEATEAVMRPYQSGETRVMACEYRYGLQHPAIPHDGTIHHTRGGRFFIDNGDWIVEGETGDIYHVKGAVFRTCYAPAQE